MRDDIDELMALHDGELPAGDTSEAREQRFDDPASRELLDKLAKADKAFAAAADELLEMPVPSRLVDAIRQPRPEPEQLAEPQSAEILPFPRRRGLVGLAIAAGLATVIATNTQLFQSPAGPTVDAGEAGYAALLQEVMESVPSGDVRSSADGSISIAPMLSFTTEADTFCREFMSSQAGAESSGVACRDRAGRWELISQQGSVSAQESDAYRVAEGLEAGAELAPALTRATELSYTEEQQAIQSGWDGSGL